jgi:hypothetical protein
MNNNLKLVLAVMTFLVTLPAFSQVSVLKGIVRADSLADFKINIINITQGSGTTTSNTGEYEIEVKVNDTLIFSAIQYQPVEINITNKIIDEGYLEVQMFDRINELEEVVLSNVSLTGNLEHDISGIETYSQEDFGFAYSPTKPLTSIERKLHTAQSEKIDALLNAISGRTKMLKTAREYEDTMEMVEKAVTIFSASFFLDNLQIPENKIKAFLFFCTEDPYFRELMSNSKRWELLEYFLEKAPDFLENNSGHRREQRSPFYSY